MPSSATSTPDIFPLSLLVALPSSSPGTGQIGGRSDLVSEQVPRSGEVSDSDQVTTFECGELCLDEMTELSELLDPGSDLHSQAPPRSEEHTSELQSRGHLVCRLLLRAPLTSSLFPYSSLFRAPLLAPVRLGGAPIW